MKNYGTKFFSGKWKIAFPAGKSICMKKLKVDYLPNGRIFFKNSFFPWKPDSIPTFCPTNFFWKKQNGVSIGIFPKSDPENTSTLKWPHTGNSKQFPSSEGSFESWNQYHSNAARRASIRFLDVGILVRVPTVPRAEFFQHYSEHFLRWLVAGN